VVDSAGDIVNESANEGSDFVRAGLAYTLGAHLEHLTLTGTSHFNGTGNALDNMLIGNSGNNTLTGDAGNDTLDGGSAGTDALRGGQGNDTYLIARTSGITITENVNEGTDAVQASVTHTLGGNVENLTLTGTAAINGTGNELANILTGNAGNNTLTGAAGSDTLTGGNGADIYSYSSGHGADTINNASTDSAQDRLNVTNLTRSQVTFTQSANDLVMTRNGTPTDRVRVTDWFAVAGNQLDFVQFTDQTLSAAQINAMFGSGLMAAPTSSAASASAPADALDSAALQFIDAMNHFGDKRRNHIIMDGGSKDYRAYEGEELAASFHPSARSTCFERKMGWREVRAQM
jgi:Ca2+-binding RTX toxin-like protein